MLSRKHSATSNFHFPQGASSKCESKTCKNPVTLHACKKSVPFRCEVENDSSGMMQQGGPSLPAKALEQALALCLPSHSAGPLAPGNSKAGSIPGDKVAYLPVRLCKSLYLSCPFRGVPSVIESVCFTS